MKQPLAPLRNIYIEKRQRCFSSVRSFKYPYTKVTETVMPWYTNIILYFTELLQVVRLYEMAYVSVRTIDDIADTGDVNLGVSHLSQVIDFLDSDRYPTNDDELLLQYIFDTATILGRDVQVLREAFINIFYCVSGDAVRRQNAVRGDFVLHTESEINAYISQMEYQGIFKLIFELFGELASEHEKIWPLVKAGRWHFYLVRDVVEDVAVGLINIPKGQLPHDIEKLVEYCRKLEETKDRNMKDRLLKIKKLGEEFPEIKQWLLRQLQAGEKELVAYSSIQLRGLSLKTRLLLWGSCRRTRRFFKQAKRFVF